MTTIDNLQDIFTNNEQRGKVIPKNVLIITSVDDHEKILSRLTPTSPETVVVNLNNKNLSDTYSINKITSKRSLSQMKNNILQDDSKNRNIKRRQGDLTCVICEGSASGYNFNQITCESCKAFFRRNALQPIEKTKCLNQKSNLNEIRCNIRYDVKYKCQRCRLSKCFESGMCKDNILTPEEKLSKQQRLEENRRMRSTQINNNNFDDTNSQTIAESPSIYTICEPIIDTQSSSSYLLTEDDWSCLHYIQGAYLSAVQSSPQVSKVISFELTLDRMSAFLNTVAIQNVAAIKLINFIRQMLEYEEIDENDRVTLVKYNLTLLFIVHHTLSFDATRELVYDDNFGTPVSPADEAYANHCKSLFILCYGYEFTRAFISILHTVNDLVNKDPVIVQLLMLSMILLKGLSVNDGQEPLLNNGQHAFHVHSKYTSLLFRYLIDLSSFDVAAIKMMRLTAEVIKIQRLMHDFHQCIKSKVDVNSVHPLMQSLFHFT